MPRISYVDPASMEDLRSQEIFELAARRGTPRPESQAIRAHVPAILHTFADTWEASYSSLVVEPALKELCRLFVSRTVACTYCGSQRGPSFGHGPLDEGDLDEVMRYEESDAFNERQKAALAYADAITWNPDAADDALWARLRAQFTEAELVELGYFIALTSGQQRWIRTLDLRHGEVLGEELAGVVPSP